MVTAPQNSHGRHIRLVVRAKGSINGTRRVMVMVMRSGSEAAVWVSEVLSASFGSEGFKFFEQQRTGEESSWRNA
jgi:hypothetical protein